MKFFQHTTMIITSSIACLLLLLSGGCTQENLSECDLYLRFRYDYNMESQDLFASQVGRVKVYLFDNDGKYHSTISQSGDPLKNNDFFIHIPYEHRDHTIVVWADSTNNSYDLTDMTSGNQIDLLLLHYKPSQLLGNQKIDNLWHSGPTKLKFDEDYNTQQTVSLLKNSNDFYIRLVDASATPITAAVKITASNGSYNYQNEYLTTNLPITYTPHKYENGTSEIRTLRLLESDLTSLSITDQAGQPITIGGANELNLIEYLLKSTPKGMGFQEYLDRCYNWQITITIDQSRALMISINNWVHWFQDIDQ